MPTSLITMLTQSDTWWTLQYTINLANKNVYNPNEVQPEYENVRNERGYGTGQYSNHGYVYNNEWVPNVQYHNSQDHSLNAGTEHGYDTWQSHGHGHVPSTEWSADVPDYDTQKQYVNVNDSHGYDTWQSHNHDQHALHTYHHPYYTTNHDVPTSMNGNNRENPEGYVSNTQNTSSDSTNTNTYAYPYMSTYPVDTNQNSYTANIEAE